MTPLPNNQPLGEFLLYETEDGKSRVECRFQDETLWLSQALMAELFETTPQNITLHLKALYEEGEIIEEATCKDYLQVQFNKICMHTKKSVKESCHRVLRTAKKVSAYPPSLSTMLNSGGFFVSVGE